MPNLSDVNNALCRKSYSFYVEHTHKGRYKHGRFTRFLCDTIQEFVETPTGHAYDILLLSVAPQHGKSMTVTETLPSWYMGKHPLSRVIVASYNSEFAKRFTDRNAEKVREFGKDIFGIEIGNTDAAEKFTLSNGIGQFISRGLMGGITGEPAELMIIDDPVKNEEEANSPTMREKLFDNWLTSCKSRLAPGAKIIVIQTRWHKEDLYGMLLQTEKNVTRINFAVECEEPNDPLGREIGETLCPEIGRDKAWWADFKQSYLTTKGSRALNALYYGRPNSIEGGLFKRGWFRYYTQAPLLAFKAISVDATFKDGKKSDFVAIQCWGKRGKDYYLLDRVKRIMGFVDTLRFIDDMIAKFPDYNAIYIEDKANGSAIVDVLSRKYRAVIAVQPEGGKEARASAVAPMVEAGNVYVRQDLDADLVDECCDFPNADHDDQVDAMTQLLNKTKTVLAQIPEPKDPYIRDYDDEVNDVLGYIGG